MLRSCSNLTWLFQLAQMKIGFFVSKRHHHASSKTQVVQKELKQSLEPSWLSLWTIPHYNFKDSPLLIQPDHHAFVTWSKTHNTRPKWVRISMIVTRPNKLKQLLGKNPENPRNINKPLSACMMMLKGDFIQQKDWTNMKSLETALRCNFFVLQGNSVDHRAASQHQKHNACAISKLVAVVPSGSGSFLSLFPNKCQSLPVPFTAL